MPDLRELQRLFPNADSSTEALQVCVCVCVRACVRCVRALHACVRVCVYVCVSTGRFYDVYF